MRLKLHSSEGKNVDSVKNKKKNKNKNEMELSTPATNSMLQRLILCLHLFTKLGGLSSSGVSREPTGGVAEYESDLMSDSVSFYIINPTSLVKTSALQQLATELTQFKIGIALVSESWFTSQHTDKLVEIDGYALHRKDRVKKKGGGVCMYVRNDIKCTPLSLNPDCNSVCIEVLWVMCCYNSVVYYIAGCYHPPKARYCDSELKSQLTRDIEELLNKSDDLGKTVIIIISGDIIITIMDTDSLEIDFGLAQVVTKLTHGNNILDKFFTIVDLLYLKLRYLLV